MSQIFGHPTARSASFKKGGLRPPESALKRSSAKPNLCRREAAICAICGPPSLKAAEPVALLQALVVRQRPVKIRQIGGAEGL